LDTRSAFGLAEPIAPAVAHTRFLNTVSAAASQLGAGKAGHQRGDRKQPDLSHNSGSLYCIPSGSAHHSPMFHKGITGVCCHTVWTLAILSIRFDGLSPSRGSWRQDRWPALGGDGLRRGTAGQNTRCEVSTIRAANSSSNREGDPHTGSHLVPVPVAEMADDGQLRAVCRQHLRPEMRLGAKTG
jgi:hypothetical protein